MALGTLKIEELGRRAVACARWRWLPGMLALYPDDTHDRVNECGDDPKDTDEDCREAWPHFEDAATLGCLLALVREAWGDPTMGAVQAGDYRLTTVAGLVTQHPSHWLVMCAGTVGLDVRSHGSSEAEALVAALEAAP